MEEDGREGGQEREGREGERGREEGREEGRVGKKEEDWWVLQVIVLTI